MRVLPPRWFFYCVSRSFYRDSGSIVFLAIQSCWSFVLIGRSTILVFASIPPCWSLDLLLALVRYQVCICYAVERPGRSSWRRLHVSVLPVRRGHSQWRGGHAAKDLVSRNWTVRGHTRWTSRRYLKHLKTDRTE